MSENDDSPATARPAIATRSGTCSGAGRHSGSRPTARRAAAAGEDCPRPGGRDRPGASLLAAASAERKFEDGYLIDESGATVALASRLGTGDAGALLGDLVPALPAGDPEPARLRRRGRARAPQARPGRRRRRARPRGQLRRQSALPGALRSGLGRRPPLSHQPAPRDPSDARRQARSELRRRCRLAELRGAPAPCSRASRDGAGPAAAGAP